MKTRFPEAMAMVSSTERQIGIHRLWASGTGAGRTDPGVPQRDMATGWDRGAAPEVSPGGSKRPSSRRFFFFSLV